MPRSSDLVMLLPTKATRATLAIDGPAAATFNTIVRAQAAYAGAAGNAITLALAAGGTWVPNIGTLTLTGNPTHAQATSVLTLTGNALRANAVGTLTLVANPANTETVTIDARVYTFQTVLTNVDGNVLIGATASDTLDNLIAAITLGAGAGTTYAAATTLHATVTAAAGAGDTMTATAKTSGTGGNSIATTDGMGDAGNVWGAVTLENGATAETVTIGATVYTFVNYLTTAFHVLIGATASATLDNLIAAINTDAGAGTTYGTGTTDHPTVTAAAGAGDTMDITAILRGTAGNLIATTDTMGAEGTWTAATMAGGTNTTVTIGAITYAFVNTATTTAYEVEISGVNASGTIDNLIACINAGAGSGTVYGSASVEHAQVRAFAGAGDTMVIHTRPNPTITDAVGTLIASTVSSAVAGVTSLFPGSWAAATLADGTDGTNVAFSVAGTAISCVFSSGYTCVEDFEAAILADSAVTALIEVSTAGTTPLYQLVITDDDFTATALSGSGATSSAAPSLTVKTAYQPAAFPADEALAMVWSEAGSGTMDVTVTIWGWEELTARGHLIGVLNDGDAIPEAAADAISHSELLVGIGGFSAFYAQIAAPGGTGTEVAVALKFLRPADRA